jgi:hypothetical protein
MAGVRGLSVGAKALVATLVVVGIFAYLVIVDLGVNAGRVHYGVRVNGIDVGGLSEADARSKLAARSEGMMLEPVVFVGEGLSFYALPRDLAWAYRPLETASTAMEVGRSGGPLTALVDRFRAWSAGVDVEWQASFRHRRGMRSQVRALARRASELGHRLDRPEMRSRIRKALNDWPRDLYYEIPFEGS